MPTVMITGASRGLGLELTRQYAQAGWQILACVRAPASAKVLQHISADHPSLVSTHTLDVEDRASIDRLAIELDGVAIDVLINSAGTMGRRSFADDGPQCGRFGDSDYDDWAQVFRLNVMGPMKMAEAFVEHLARSDQKKLVTLSSILGSIEKNTIGGLYAYRASKAAVNAIMRSMAIDLARSYGIIATALHPGWVRTDMSGPTADIDAETSARGMRRVIDGLDAGKAGRYWVYDGSELPW